MSKTKKAGTGKRRGDAFRRAPPGTGRKRAGVIKSAPPGTGRKRLTQKLNAALDARHESVMGEIGTLRRIIAEELGIPIPRRDVTLRDLVRAADNAGAEIEVDVRPRCRLADPYFEYARGCRVYVKPISGSEKIFDVRGVRVEIMRNTDGELIMELTRDGKVIGTTMVADHFQITTDEG